MVAQKRVYWENIKKYLIAGGIVGSVGLVALFMYLQSIGAITITGYNYTPQCAGTVEEPCYLYINFTANQDIFIYPVGYDPYGRNTPFTFDVPLKEWRLERSWGIGWREIPLNQSCRGTWCGAPSSTSNVTYSVVFRAGKNYQIRLTGYKYNLTQDISWWFE